MATFNFSTKNKYIDGKIDYIISRKSTGYTVSYTVYLSRNNNWTGTATHGSLDCYIYSNGTHQRTISHNSFTVLNSGAWCEVGNGSYDVSLGAWNSATHTIGVRMTGADGITGLHADYQTQAYSVKTYKTVSGKSTSVFLDYKNNSFAIKTTIGINGNNSPAEGCHIYGTTNGTSPSTSNYNFVYVVSGVQREVKDTIFKLDNSVSDHDMDEKKIKPKGKSTRVWVKPHTVCGDSNGNNHVADTAYADVYFYEPPEWTGTPYLTHLNGAKPTYKSKYRVDWSNKVKSKNTTPIYKYALYLQVGTNEYTLADNIKTTYYEFDGRDYNLEKDDDITVKVVAYDKYGDGTDITSEKFSDTVTVESSGVLRTKISDNEWVEGQVYAYTGNGWVEAVGVYVKVDNTNNGWKESI
jgi:hypothetical protein